MISLIAAHDSNAGIGKNGKMPWHIPQELTYFKFLTIGKPVIMGRKTFESIGAPLSDRLNIVLTTDTEYQAPEGVVVLNSLQDALGYVAIHDVSNREIMIIGGGQLYEEAIALADRLYVTQIHQTFECDTFFPDYSEKFKELFRSPAQVYAVDSLSYEYTIYEKAIQ